MSATYKSVDIQRADYSLWLDIAGDGLYTSPKVRGKDTIVPAFSGKIPRNRVADELRIVLKGWIKGDTWAEYYSLLDELRSLFDPTSGEGALAFDLQDATATATARPLNMIPDGQEAIGASRGFSVELVAVNPAAWTVTPFGQASPDPVAMTYAIPVPTLTIGKLLTPDPVAMTYTVPDPTLTAGPGRTVTPDPVAMTFAVPVPTVTAS